MPSVPAVTMQKPGKQTELAERIPAFFFFQRHSWEFFYEGKEDQLFWLDSIHAFWIQ